MRPNEQKCEWCPKNLHPCCEYHARSWEETQNGKYPPSEHSPNCPNYRPVKFCAVRAPEGVSEAACIMPPGDVQEFAKEMDEGYRVEEIYLTEDQFRNLREFEGY